MYNLFCCSDNAYVDTLPKKSATQQQKTTEGDVAYSNCILDIVVLCLKNIMNIFFLGIIVRYPKLVQAGALLNFTVNLLKSHVDQHNHGVVGFCDSII